MNFEDLTFTLRTYDTQRTTQRVGVWQPPASQSSGSTQAESKGYWLVFVHGGAWRDPSNTYADFIPSIKHILSTTPASSIRGFASIDYRLSPHPKHPQDPSTTPVADLNDARHPEHIDDVCAAMRLLRDEYGVGDGSYMLIGHSAGATLACQLLSRSRVPTPAAVLGISGIYSLPLLVETCGPYYEAFVRGAFGEPENWEVASPALCDTKGWPCDMVTVLAWSVDDTLIPASETDAMAKRMRADGREVVVHKGLTGEHDAIWSEGPQLANAVKITLDTLDKQ